ncbi:hypothetical protein MJO28_009785 [Puccinia striiformis f. sp. tritici]|uniref:Uncharacterized protein n=1 Tax=Puccinia striiformis f. sp. tritici TaxID=168172 RepID=A0ACC0E8M4_9BASI|nr:hypothetical protein MJO28_009785 [Puccinia striiformis f. sp. tritici]
MKKGPESLDSLSSIHEDANLGDGTGGSRAPKRVNLDHSSDDSMLDTEKHSILASQRNSVTEQQAMAFGRLIGQLDEEKSLTPEIKKVTKLDQEAKVLSTDKTTILKSFDDMKSIWQIRVSVIQDRNAVPALRRQISSLSQASSLVKACQEKAEIFVKLALLKLGGQDSGERYGGLIKSLLPNQQLPADIPKEISRLEAENQLETAAAATLAQVKKLLHTTSELQSKLSPWSYDSQHWYHAYQYAFTVVDLLSENGFIDQRELQIFLREQEMAKIVTKYADEPSTGKPETL